MKNKIFEYIKNNWVVTTIVLVIFVIFLLPTFSDKNLENYSSYTTSPEPRTEQVVKQTTPSQAPPISYKEYKTLVEGEELFNKNLRELEKSYPWYSKIPIENNDYVIIYDFDKESFRIIVKETTELANVNDITNKALEDIREIGADPKSYYLVFPE